MPRNASRWTVLYPYDDDDCNARRDDPYRNLAELTRNAKEFRRQIRDGDPTRRVRHGIAGIMLLPLVTVIGCTDSPVHDFSVNDFHHAILGALCANLTACCGVTVPADACVDQLRSSMGAHHELQAEAVAAGRLEFHEGPARACVDHMQALSCPDFEAMGAPGAWPACHGAFVAKVATGGDCAVSAECADADTYCEVAIFARLGTCVVKPGAGDPCTHECGEGLVCPSKRGSFCVAAKPNGQACESDRACLSGYCNDSGGETICSDPEANGQPCANDSQCKEGNCDTSSDPPVCAPKRPDGATCTTGDECANGACVDHRGSGVYTCASAASGCSISL
ncbi:hypothetical protein [Sorangium sp. So ce1335]|uniref:hypothetical protein n=1 Tax=Sorangium sp. So ce1335 TaxID=3133335 RepID=UPI003F5E739C